MSGGVTDDKESAVAVGKAADSAEPVVYAHASQADKGSNHQVENDVGRGGAAPDGTYGRRDVFKEVSAVFGGDLRGRHAAKHGICPKCLFARLVSIIARFLALSVPKFDIVLIEDIAIEVGRAQKGYVDAEQNDHRRNPSR